MKKTVLLAVFAFTVIFASAQEKTNGKRNSMKQATKEAKNFTYTFTKATGTYADLVNPTSLNNGQTWDDPEYNIPLTFPILVNGEAVQLLSIDGYGSDLLASTGVANIYNSIYPFGADLIDRGFATDVSVSPISYKVEGTAGSRILKIEWKNAGSYDEEAPYSMFVNIQAWFYETSNIIEFHYGPSSITDAQLFYGGDEGAWIGIGKFAIDANDEIEVLITNALTGNVDNPTLNSVYDFINGTPANGTVYRFTPATPSGINENNNTFAVYPNPANNIINISNVTPKSNIVITNTIGAVVYSQEANNTIEMINVENFAKGVYFISIKNNYEINTVKFIKQ